MTSAEALVKIEDHLLNKFVRVDRLVIDVDFKELAKSREIVKVIKIDASEIDCGHFKLAIKVARFQNEDSEIVIHTRGAIEEFTNDCYGLFKLKL